LQPELDADSLENRVRFTCSWDGLVFNTWFRVDQPGEALFKSIEHAIENRGGTIDRASALLILERGRAIPPGSPCAQPLNEERLRSESDWKGTLKWLRTTKMKSQESDQIYGTIIDTFSSGASKSMGKDFNTGITDAILNTIKILKDKHVHRKDVSVTLEEDAGELTYLSD
jgi:hypothetical protein